MVSGGREQQETTDAANIQKCKKGFGKDEVPSSNLGISSNKRASETIVFGALFIFLITFRCQFEKSSIPAISNLAEKY